VNFISVFLRNLLFIYKIIIISSLDKNCYTKTIRDHISSKKEFGEWVHPDIVGCYYRMEDWKQEMNEFSRAVGGNSVVLHLQIKYKAGLNNLSLVFK